MCPCTYVPDLSCLIAHGWCERAMIECDIYAGTLPLKRNVGEREQIIPDVFKPKGFKHIALDFQMTMLAGIRITIEAYAFRTRPE